MKRKITPGEYADICEALYGLTAVLSAVGIVELCISEKDEQIFWDTKGGGMIDPVMLTHFSSAVDILGEKLIKVAGDE